MADDEIPGKDEADDLDPAFDSIDETMKDMARRDVTVTPETLADIVNDAVTKAITAYEQSRGVTPAADDPAPAAALPTKPSSDLVPPRQPARQTSVPLSPWRKKIEQLKGDMGLDEIKFDGPRPEPVEVVVQRELLSQMGVNDFKFDDAPGPPAEANAPTRIEADAIAGWATPGVEPQPTVPLEVNDIADFAPTPEKIVDSREDFDWVAEQLARVTDEPEPPPQDKPAPRKPVAKADPFSEPSVVLPSAVEPGEPVEPVEPAHSDLGDTLSSLANWFRSALTERPQPREPESAAVIPVAEPAAAEPPPAPPAPAPPVVAPAPPVVAPAATAVRPEPERRPAPDYASPAKASTPEEAAPPIRFTFDPILPVPPRLLREPKDPPKR